MKKKIARITVIVSVLVALLVTVLCLLTCHPCIYLPNGPSVPDSTRLEQGTIPQ